MANYSIKNIHPMKSFNSSSVEPRATLFDIFFRLFKSKNLLGDSSTVHHTYNGRAALYQLFLSIPSNLGTTILLPAFHCPTVVEPALAAGYKVKFYDVGLTLTESGDDFSHLIDSSVAAVLVINYFGFQFNIDDLVDSCSKDYLIIEDCSHSFFNAKSLSLTGNRGDASVYSFWKLLPSLVGGGVKIHTNRLELVEMSSGVAVTNTLRVTKRILERAVCEFSDKISLLSWAASRFKVRESKLLSGPVTDRDINTSYPFSVEGCRLNTPWLSKQIISHSDLQSMASKRRRNYEICLELLQEKSGLAVLMPNLSEDVCPWAFPVLIDDRYNNDYVLKNKGLLFFTFGEILHPALYQGGRNYFVSQKISDGILCLPIHQDLSNQEVELNCHILIEHFRNLEVIEKRL